MSFLLVEATGVGVDLEGPGVALDERGSDPTDRALDDGAPAGNSSGDGGALGTVSGVLQLEQRRFLSTTMGGKNGFSSASWYSSAGEATHMINIRYHCQDYTIKHLRVIGVNDGWMTSTKAGMCQRKSGYPCRRRRRTDLVNSKEQIPEASSTPPLSSSGP